MALKVELETWQEGVKHFENEKWNNALDIFESIADSAKLHFNVAMVFLNINRIPDAITSLSRTISCDPYFAVAYFQRGSCLFSQDEIEEALRDFDSAYEFLRGNQFIDYTQLGLDFKLFSFEILFNRGLCFAALGDARNAIADFKDAVEQRPSEMKEKYRALDEALRMDIGLVHEKLNAFMVPKDKCYKPPASKVKNTKKIDFLGQSKVVAAVDVNDGFIGFSGKALRETLGRPATVKKSDIPSRAQTVKNSQPDRIERERDMLGSNSVRSDISRRANTFANGSDSISRANGRSATLGRLPRGRNNSIGRDPQDNSLARNINETRKQENSFARGETLRRSNSVGRADNRGKSDRDDYIEDNTPVVITARKSSIGRTGRGTLPLPQRNSSQTRINHRPDFERHARNASDSSLAFATTRRDTDTPSASDKLKVKVHGKDIRMVLVPYDVTYEDLRNRICQKFDLDTYSTSVKLKYRDEELELVLMTDQEDLEVAFGCAGLEYGRPPRETDKFEIWLYY